MGWFRKSRKRKPPDVKSEDLWVQCPKCSAHIFREEWQKNLKTCPKCSFHERLTCGERLELTVDDGTFHELAAGVTAADPLGFADETGTYAAKLQAARQKTGLQEAVQTGRGRIKGTEAVIGIMDFRFVGGSLGSGTGEKIFRAADYALRHRLPYILVSASGGARMQEGMVSLMQMAKTCAGVARLRKARLPYISVLTDPTMGGVSASYAMVGDVNLAEPGALIGFAGRRVIEQTIKQKLPDDFQTAEYLLEHGFLDMIVHRRDLKGTLHSLLQYCQRK